MDTVRDNPKSDRLILADLSFVIVELLQLYLTKDIMWTCCSYNSEKSIAFELNKTSKAFFYAGL